MTRIDGLILMLFFMVFLYYTFATSRIKSEDTVPERFKQYGTPISLLMIGLGIAGMALGGTWIVDGATEIATQFGLSQSLIGFTILAVGTSLPELAVVIAAARRKNVDMIAGSIIGSNIFNIFMVLGVSSIIAPMTFSLGQNINLLVVGFATVLLFVFLFLGKKHTLQRWQGIAFLVMYVGYLTFLIFRG